MSNPSTRLTNKDGFEITSTVEGNKLRLDISIDAAALKDLNSIKTDIKGTNTRLDAVTQTRGGQEHFIVRDIAEKFSDILTQLKIIVAQNNEVHQLTMNEMDVK